MIISKGVTLRLDTAMFHQYIWEWSRIKTHNKWANINTLFQRKILELQKTVTTAGSLEYAESVSHVQYMNTEYTRNEFNDET